MKYIVAVSGGVDSMVLLDVMARAKEHEFVVAHFDHGIRPDSHLDAQFVGEAAQKYGVRFETAKEALGPDASEALARDRRYAFLRQVSKKYDAPIVTAHHLDDLVESVTINMHRGTGWRGVAALDSEIVRPLIDIEKARLVAYANHHGIKWREDSTNASDKYLRNRLRPKLQVAPSDTKRQIRALHAHQKALKREIEAEARALVGDGPSYSRYLLTHVSTSVALECLRAITHGRLTRPQLTRVLHAIKTAKPNTRFEAGNGLTVHFTTRQFSL